jgi:isoleucyl-tRNA synthetase
MPFVTERVWGALFTSTGAADSVHLTSWPEPDPGLIDPALAEQVGLVRRLVELGRAARAESKVKTRQPLARALISAPGWTNLPEALREEVRAELNVEALTPAERRRRAGRGRGQAQLPGAGQAVRQADPAGGRRDPGRRRGVFVAAYRAGHGDGEPGRSELPISGDEVVVSETPRSGWAVASAGSDTVALDLELSHELRLAGLLREIVRLVQEGRKSGGLDVSDRIELWWRVGGSPGSGRGDPHAPGPLSPPRCWPRWSTRASRAPGAGRGA